MGMAPEPGKGKFSSAVTLVRTADCAGQEGDCWEVLAQVSPLITALHTLKHNVRHFHDLNFPFQFKSDGQSMSLSPRFPSNTVLPSLLLGQADGS